jgi:hypothetical protein
MFCFERQFFLTHCKPMCVCVAQGWEVTQFLTHTHTDIRTLHTQRTGKRCMCVNHQLNSHIEISIDINTNTPTHHHKKSTPTQQQSHAHNNTRRHIPHSTNTANQHSSTSTAAQVVMNNNKNINHQYMHQHSFAHWTTKGFRAFITGTENSTVFSLTQSFDS